MTKTILKTEALTKKYGNKVVLDNVNVTVNKGDVYGLVGRNGAGKTTLMRVALSLTQETRGSVYLFDEDNKKLDTHKRVGSLIENPAFFPNMTAYNNLKYYCIQRGIVNYDQIDKALQSVDLANTGKKKFRTFSLGMKQRLGIALALLCNPDFVILDEPINGLDPIGISNMRDTFHRLNTEDNVTLMISSHILSELYLVCNKFGFIENGQLIKELTKEELDEECSKCLAITVNDVKKACLVIENELHSTDYKVIDEHEIRLYDFLDQPGKVNSQLISGGIQVDKIVETGLSLEDYFKSIIGGGTNA